MRFIAHRGNVNGNDIEKENTVEYVISAINREFDVEIDLWFIDENFYLGHDTPKNVVDLAFLRLYSRFLWCHSKTINTLNELLKYPDINCFFHQNDDVTLTSHKYIWTYPEKPLTERSILLKFTRDEKYIIPTNIMGICSDNIEYYRNKIKI